MHFLHNIKNYKSEYQNFNILNSVGSVESEARKKKFFFKMKRELNNFLIYVRSLQVLELRYKGEASGIKPVFIPYQKICEILGCLLYTSPSPRD